MQNEAKSDLKFSPEEWSIILNLSSWRGTVGNRLGWYASVLGSIVLFCAYGVWKGEAIAVELAFACLLAYVIWSSMGELRGLQVYHSIFSRIVAFKESQGPSAAPETSS
jgi:hypothetical protein